MKFITAPKFRPSLGRTAIANYALPGAADGSLVTGPRPIHLNAAAL